MLDLREDVPLAPLTTLRLGGPARWLAACRDVGDVREALRFAEERDLPVLLLGGGSNLVLPDEGWPGLVARIEVPGMEFRPGTGVDDDVVEVEAGAGVVWDALVDAAVERGLSGIECLTGIPGSVGAAPMQNIGAYGQELADTLVEVTCLDRESREEVVIPADACDFRYRWSRFKGPDRDRFVILRVRLRLRRGTVPEIVYEELARALEEGSPPPEAAGTEDPPARIRRVRDTVRELRAGKSMLAGQDVRSAGSFFLNPVLARAELERVRAAWRERGGEGGVPRYRVDEGWKVPAAWLVEGAGYEKGTTRGNAAVSRDHALALVNRGGTTEELLALAREIREAVEATFGVQLEPEPTIVRPPGRQG
jgi:UDP-N-acetylmuramate dehydrogenase